MVTIQVEGLSRRFKELLAVDRISFSVEEGEIFGFLGPNGSGKTTTIRMLTGQLLPSEGRAIVAGCDVTREYRHLKPQIGVVFEHQNLYARMSGRENLIFGAQLYGVSGQRVDEVLDQVGLRERSGDRVQHYSNGMKQRLLIARALLHRPRILFLDEPTRGLDPAVARDIRRLIVEAAAEGMSVFLTTHYMEEADQLCQRVAFLSEGRIVVLDTPRNLKLAHGKQRATLALTDGNVLDLDLADRKDMQRLGESAVAGEILTLHSAEATLEEVFIKLTGRRLVE